MTKSKMANRYSPEVSARAVRMVFEHQGSYETQAGAIAAIAPVSHWWTSPTCALAVGA